MRRSELTRSFDLMTSRLSLESLPSSGALLARNAKYCHNYGKAGSATDGGKCLLCQYVMQSIMTMKASGGCSKSERGGEVCRAGESRVRGVAAAVRWPVWRGMAGATQPTSPVLTRSQSLTERARERRSRCGRSLPLSLTRTPHSWMFI